MSIVVSTSGKDIYVDIDDTICWTPPPDETTGARDYSQCRPHEDRIQILNELYRQGYIITYWTARGNRSGNDFRQHTENQLKSWNVLYNELKMGKPSFDIFVDDKAFQANDTTIWEHLKQQIKADDALVPKTKKNKEPIDIVSKKWGCEIIFVNNQHYCGKILRFLADTQFSMHFHLQKQETWYVLSGTFLLKWIDTNDASCYTEPLSQGDVVTNYQGQPHQIVCLTSGDILEVSTTHYDSDSYRVFPGSSQQQHTSTQHSCCSCTHQ